MEGPGDGAPALCDLWSPVHLVMCATQTQSVSSGSHFWEIGLALSPPLTSQSGDFFNHTQPAWVAMFAEGIEFV